MKGTNNVRLLLIFIQKGKSREWNVAYKHRLLIIKKKKIPNDGGGWGVHLQKESFVKYLMGLCYLPTLLSCFSFTVISLVLFSHRSSLDNAYPLSLVDIVEDLEGKSRVQEHYLSSNPATAGGLDTTDSGYSQDTYKERSPLNSENVNSDDEEAAVLGDIFFLSGRI